MLFNKKNPLSSPPQGVGSHEKVQQGLSFYNWQLFDYCASPSPNILIELFHALPERQLLVEPLTRNIGVLRFANLLHGDTLHASNDVSHTSNSNRLITPLDHTPLGPLLLLNRLG